MSRKSMLLTAFLFSLVFAASQVGAVVGADWPSVRHDAGLTGMSPLKGGFGQAPVELWSVDLGGPLLPTEYSSFQEVNNDGKLEVLRPLADRLVCQTLTGKVLWVVKNIQNPAIRDVRDYAGDGGRGLLITYADGLNVVYAMVDGRTGKKAVLFSTHDVFGGTARTGHILPGVRGQQYCFPWSGGNEEAWFHLFSFEKGPANPTRRLYAYEKAMIYAPLHVFVDVDGDGQNEFVVLSHQQLWAYDLGTSKLKFYTTWVRNRIRSYTSGAGMMPLKPGQLPSLIEINPHLPGVQVITQDGKGRSKPLWKKLVWREEYQYQNEVKIASGAPNPFMDIDGDGQIEIMASVTNEHGDNLKHLVIWGADKGDRLFDESGCAVLGVEDLDGDGKPEMLLKRGDTLSIANFNGKTFVDRWQSKTAEPLFVPRAPEGDLTLMSQSADMANRTLWREKAGSSNFLMKIDGKTWSCKLASGGSLEQVGPIEVHEALSNVPGPPPKAPYSWDGYTLKTKVDGKEVVGYELPYHKVYLAPPPVTAILGGEMRTLVRGHDSSLMSISATGKDVRKLADKVSNDTSCAIADMDGDGQADVICSLTDSDGKPAVRIVDASGKVLRTYHPAAEGGSFVLGPTGSLGAGNGRWFAVMVRNPFTRPMVIAYDGKTGKEIMRRPGYGVYDNEPSQFVLHIPTVVWDYNADGIDDLLCLSENFYGIIDVAHDKDLVDPMAKTMLSNTLPSHWTAYAYPTLLANPDGKPRIALSKSYEMVMYVIDPEGWPVWHYGAERDATTRNMVGVADMDGDGKTELVGARQDGLITAFNWDADNKTCFRCQPNEPLGKLNHAGKIRWTFNLLPPISDFASADLDGDGKTELLCGAGDGKLYALKEKGGKCSILWSVDLKQTVGAPTIADINGDGKAEILVTSESGTLHCLGARQ